MNEQKINQLIEELKKEWEKIDGRTLSVWDSNFLKDETGLDVEDIKDILYQPDNKQIFLVWDSNLVKNHALYRKVLRKKIQELKLEE
jgi:hypothetical protein